MKEELAQTTNHVSANFFKKITYFPVDTRRRFNVDTTPYDVVRRRIDVETTSCVYSSQKYSEFANWNLQIFERVISTYNE